MLLYVSVWRLPHTTQGKIVTVTSTGYTANYRIMYNKKKLPVLNRDIEILAPISIYMSQ